MTDSVAMDLCVPGTDAARRTATLFSFWHRQCASRGASRAAFRPGAVVF